MRKHNLQTLTFYF